MLAEKIVTACSQEDLDLLVSAADLCADLPGDFVEVGSYKCGSTIALAMRHPEKRIFACDLFGGNPYPERSQFAHLTDNFLPDVIERVQKFKNIVLVQGRHEDTLSTLKCEQVAFLFLDSDWYESHAAALMALAGRIPTGGIIAFHDWSYSEVRFAVFETLNFPDWCLLEGKYAFQQGKQGMAFLRRL